MNGCNCVQVHCGLRWYSPALIQLSAPSAWVPTWYAMPVLNKHPLNAFGVCPEEKPLQKAINS